MIEIPPDVVRGGAYVVFATGWAITGYMTKVSQDDDVEFEWPHAGKTIMIGVIAGLIMAGSGDALTHEAAAGALAVAIPIADKIANLYL